MRIGNVSVKPRFIVILVSLGIGVFLLVKACTGGERTALVRVGNTGDSTKTQVVLVRDEPVYYSDNLGSVEYIAREGAQVQEGDLIARVFTDGAYTSQRVADLRAKNQEIKALQLESLDAEIIDTQLDGMNDGIYGSAELFAAGVNGGMLTAENELISGMEKRQDYIRMKMIDNKKLEPLYSQADTLKESLRSWRSEERAKSAGMISFYLDGCESFLTPAVLDRIAVSDFKNLAKGEIPTPPQDALGKQALYKTIKSSTWYALFLVPKNDWKVAVHQPCVIRLEDCLDIAFSATVIKQTEDGGNLFVQLEISEGAERLSDIRTCGAEISGQADGLLVPVSALLTQGGEICVRVKDGMATQLVSVSVIAQDSYNALVRPKTEGALAVNMTVVY